MIGDVIYILKYNMYKSPGGAWANKFYAVLQKHKDYIEKIGRSTYMFFDPDAMLDVVNVLAEYKHIIGLDFIFKVNIVDQLQDPYIQAVFEKMGVFAYNKEDQKLNEYIKILNQYLHGNQRYKTRAIKLSYPSNVAINVAKAYIRMARPELIDKYKQLALEVQKKEGLVSPEIRVAKERNTVESKLKSIEDLILEEYKKIKQQSEENENI